MARRVQPVLRLGSDHEIVFAVGDVAELARFLFDQSADGVEAVEAAPAVEIDALSLRRDETTDRRLARVPAHRMLAPVDTGDRLPRHDPRRFEDVPVVLRPGEDARGPDQAGQVVIDGCLDDSCPIWLL